MEKIFTELLGRLPSLTEVSPAGALLVAGVRSFVVAHKIGCWPAGALKERLGCARAAAHVGLLIAEIGAAWPDPFAVSPPCCPRLSHDEALLAALLDRAAARDRHGFDRLAEEMLGGDARERLFLSLKVLAGVLQR